LKRYILYNVYLGAVLSALLCGCGAGRQEMEDVFLVEALGVDWSEEAVVLTAADKEKLLRAEGSTAQQSHRHLKEGGEGYVALTHVEHIVAGAECDLRAVLEGALQGEEVGQTALLWMAEAGSARDLMEQVNGGVRRLEAIEKNAQGLRPVSVMEGLTCLEETGVVALPTLAVEKGELIWTGERIWTESR